MTPSPADDSGLLPAILANYADDGPRLILSDFLEESGHPADAARAELIRIQIALARISDEHPRQAELLSRQQELLQLHLGEWTKPYADLADGFEFRRGLLDAVSVEAGKFLRTADRLFARLPVRRLRLLEVGRNLPELIEFPGLRQVRELVLCGNDLGDGGVGLLLRSPHLSAVELLDLSFTGLGDTAVRAVARTTMLPRLRKLLLSDNGRITSSGVAVLAASPQRARLTMLDLSDNDIDEHGVRALATSPHLQKLRVVRLHGNRIGDAGVKELLDSALFERMLARDRRLDLRQNEIGTPGAMTLARSERMRGLTTLDLSDNHLGDGGLAAIAYSPNFTRLRRLLIRQNGITDDGAIALAHSPLMARLERLDLSGNRLTRKGIDALYARRPNWRTELEAAGNFVSENPFPLSGIPFDETVELTAIEVARILRRTVPSEFLPDPPPSIS